MSIRIIIFHIGLFSALVSFGQVPSDAFEIKPSTPGEPVALEIAHMYTDFKVVGYAGDNILIEMSKGILGSKVTNPPVRFVEDNNKISITHSNSWTKGYGMILWVPLNTSAAVDATYASSINISNVKGDVKVDSHSADVALANIEGNIDINTFKGDITVNNLNGSPLLHTNNGNIRIDFMALPEAYPNILVSMYGNIELALQQDANISFRFKMERNFDKIQSDFRLQPIQPSDFPMGKEGAFNYYRTINNGGVPIFMRTFRGNFRIIRQGN